jgi:opacity protein-like surface antigen
MDSGLLKVRLGRNVDLYLNFDRYTKKGNSVTTFDINRIEFEFDKPIMEDLNEVAVGINIHLKRYSFLFEEKFQDYENTNSLFLPGYADGGANAGYPSALKYFNLNQPSDFTSNIHTFKLNARPFDSLMIAGSAKFINLDMNLYYSEEADGINYLNRPFSYSYSGEGNFDRKFQLYDFDVSYLLFNKLSIIGAFRYHDFEQEGSLTVDGEEESAVLNFDTLGVEGGLQYQFSPKYALTVGYRYEARDLEGTETVTYEEETKRNGFFGNLRADISQAFRVTADYQHGSYDDPYTLISPTSFDRFKLTAKFRKKQFNVSGSYLYNKSKSEIYDDLWESTKNQLNIRVGYHTDKLNIRGGYSLIDVEHKGDRTVTYPPSWSGPAGTFLWEIFYEGKSHLLDASFSLSMDKNWKVGGYGNSYTNKGFWEISRTMLKGYLEYVFETGLVAQLGYRYVDFEEKDSGYNDYKANIFEISFGYRWK